VVKKAAAIKDNDVDGVSYECSECRTSWHPNSGESTNFCPGCGADIVKP
jgi:predicted RNA-binding Zn-ribbon protein involved in translation (DUF1610 family)